MPVLTVNRAELHHGLRRTNKSLRTYREMT
jgi:hypothetical protein